MADEQKEPTQEEFQENADPYYDQAQIDLNRKIAEKAASDENFRQLLETDPDAAFEQAGLRDEVDALVSESAEKAGVEVSGHTHRIKTYYRSCRWYRYGLWWHWR